MIRNLVPLFATVAIALTTGPAACLPPHTPVRGSFVDYLLITNVQTTPEGAPAWFTSGMHFDGWVHTNDELRFDGAPYFVDSVTSAGSRAWFRNGGLPVESDDDRADVDVPMFERGFTRNAMHVPFPTHAYIQQWCALGGFGFDRPTNSVVRSALGLLHSSEPLPDGIYVPNSGNAIGGGIYVHGDADQIVAVADTIANHQMLRITQSGVVTVVTIDTARNATEVTTATRTSTYQGIPRGIVYVTGAVRDLRGPGRVGSWIPAALLDGQWSFVAEGDIVVCGDLMDRGFPEVVPDTGCAASAIAGLWSVHGSVRIGADAPNDLHLDAFILAGGASGTFTVDDYAVGPPRGTLYVRGGVAEQYVGTFGVVDAAGHVLCGYAPSLRYDRRQLFPPWGLFPPYWPTVALPPLVESPVVRPPTATLHLAAPYPNPARSTVHVRFTLPTAGHARLTVFDIQGRRVAMPLDANQTAGEHVLDWSRGRSRGPLAPGIYFIRLEAGGASRSARVVLLN